MRFIDKRTIGTLLVLAAPLVWADDSGYTALFDGKTLSGWIAERTDRFAVRDGVVVQDGGTGWLRSAKPYKDFEFEAEYRALKKGADSGIFFRASSASSSQPPFWPEKGYQLQVIDSVDSHLKIFGHGTAPPTYDRKADELAKVLKGPGEWQTIHLRVVGRRVEVSLNGARITVSDSVSLPEGCIGIQGENGQFEWRKLKIKSL
ncbi:MAG: DUF1080 domain-containing protein [Isosphaeraceae bacterium]|nr:DUF1080 domain-containing protein [Isosphaeraceae bacterium]